MCALVNARISLRVSKRFMFSIWMHGCVCVCGCYGTLVKPLTRAHMIAFNYFRGKYTGCFSLLLIPRASMTGAQTELTGGLKGGEGTRRGTDRQADGQGHGPLEVQGSYYGLVARVYWAWERPTQRATKLPFPAKHVNDCRNNKSSETAAFIAGYPFLCRPLDTDVINDKTQLVSYQLLPHLISTKDCVFNSHRVRVCICEF